jgi:hypothetical protein
MARIFGCEMLAFEDVAQMRSASRAGYFRAPPIRIQAALDRAGDLVIKTRPTAAGVEFIFGTVKRSIAAPAIIRAGFEKLIVFPAKRWFGTFILDNVCFPWGKFIPGHFYSFVYKISIWSEMPE